MHEYSGEPMHGVDAAWLRMDRPTNRMVITAMVVVDRMEFKQFREVVRQRFLTFERFCRKPVLHSGLYFWEPDEQFDLNAHLFQAQRPAPGDKRALQQYVGTLLNQPLPQGRPLWRFHFIQDYGGQSVVILQVHHCYADGLSLVAVFGALTNERPRPLAAGAARRAANDEDLGGASSGPVHRQILDTRLHRSLEKYGRFRRSASEESPHRLREPASLLNAGRSMLGWVGEVSRLAAQPSDPRTCLTGDLGETKACAWSDPIPLARLKVLGRYLGVSLNDVLLSCVTGLLRRHLEAHQEVDAALRIHATVPVNVRLPEAEPQAEGLGEIGNHFGTLFMALPVGVVNPIERIYRIKHEMQALRQSLQPGLTYGALAALGLMPGRVQRQIIDSFSRKSSLVLSNVPGVQQARYLAESKIHQALYWVPQSGDTAVGISLLSYNGQVQLGLSVDTQVVARPQTLIDDFVRELERHESSLARLSLPTDSPVPVADVGLAP